MSNLRNQPLDYWKDKLSQQQFDVCILKGTEAPFTGKHLHNQIPGVYACVACGTPLFSSQTKFDSGSGWPSFWEAMNKDNVELHPDHSLGTTRTEVTCKNCGAHLGHLFEDGPAPTNLRYCINSVALDFQPHPQTI